MIRVTALELPLVNAFARLRKQYDLLVGQKVKMAFLLDTQAIFEIGNYCSSVARLTVDSPTEVCGKRSDSVRGNVVAPPMGFMRQVWNTSYSLISWANCFTAVEQHRREETITRTFSEGLWHPSASDRHSRDDKSPFSCPNS